MGVVMLEREKRAECVRLARSMGWEVVAIPNNKQSRREIGYRAGAADLVMCRKGITAFVEMKNAEGKQSKAQEEFQASVGREGIPYAVIRSAEELEGFLKGVSA